MSEASVAAALAALNLSGATPSSATSAAKPRCAPLWPGRAHPELRIFDAACPPMHRRAAMIVFRGGGYRINNGSGEHCAAYFAERGVLGIEAEYRTVEGPGECACGKDSSGPLFPRPLQDAARAVRLVRSKASELGVDPNRIGVVGFSAGGHLASILCAGVLPCQEAADEDLLEISFRPDVCILSYAVLSMLPDLMGPNALGGSKENLCFPEGDEERLSTELHVTRAHPPTFLWHTRSDPIVPFEHSQRYAEALQDKQVPHKLMLFDEGPHALGMALSGAHANDWAANVWEWLGQWTAPQLCVPAPEL